ncbi:MAG TPA: ATP-binding cassette domain-containing protein [Acidimicrobiales bacterium]|nr:ATP-binding cassette domain-containing protein [Acidimicrobiales bacterium]
MTIRLILTNPAGNIRELVIDRSLTVGREGTDLVLEDQSVSRSHLRLEPVEAMGDRPSGVRVTDLGSSNGTFVADTRIEGPVVLVDGESLVAGQTRIEIRVDPDPAARRVRPTPVAPAMEEIEADDIVVSFVPGSAGSKVAKSVLDTARRARRNLAGLGSEPWHTRVTINLVDPFPDPENPESIITGGSVVDPDNSVVWMAVSAESAPEDPHRPLAVLFGSVLPAAAEVGHILEGYGLHLAGTPEPAPEEVAGLGGSLDSLDPTRRGPFLASFVAFLISREGEDALRQLLAAPQGGLNEAWNRIYGRSEAAMEHMWWGERGEEKPELGTLDFLKMSWRYVRPYRLRQAEVFAYMLLSLGFTVTYPFVTRSLFDTAIPSGEMSRVLQLLGILGIAFAISLAASVRQTYQGSWISGSVVRDLRRDIFGRLQRVPDAWVYRHPQGDVLTRLLSDVGQVESGLSTALSDGVFQVVSLIVSTIIMLKVSFVLGLIVLAGAPVVAIIYTRMSDGARRRSLAVQEEYSGVVTVASENYQANRVVKLFRLAGREEKRFDRASGRLFDSQLRLSLFGGLFGVAVEGTMTLLRLAILGIGTWLIFEGNFTLGGLVAFLGIMGEVLSPVTGLTSLGQSIQASVGSLIRLEEVLQAEPEPEGADLPALAPLSSDIRLENVSLSYTPEQRALDGVDVTIPAGSRVAFVGPSGSGKSTTLNILMRLYEPDEGRLLFDGVDVRERSLASLRSQMGVVFQDSFLFDATVRENIAMGEEGVTEDQIRAAATAAEVDEFIDNLSHGFDTLVGEGGRNLSGGQRQRVAIARALVADPPILLLDEATSALDPRTERQITSTLERAGAGRTVVAITHRLTSIADYDIIFVIDDGRVVEHGSHDLLVENRGVYARLWAEQTGAPLPEAEAVDLADVLSDLPPFVNLDGEDLAEVAAMFDQIRLEPGATEVEGGRLAVVLSGMAEVVAAGSDHGSLPMRELGRGAVFGLNALLGQNQGNMLRARSEVTLAVLDADRLEDLRTRFESVEAGLSGRSTLMGAPRGTVVSRLTIGPQTRSTHGGPGAPAG